MEILIREIDEKIEKKLKELSLKPEISPQEFSKIHKFGKHRYFSSCLTEKNERVSFYSRLHNNLDAKEKFIREISFLKEIQKSKFEIKKSIPKILDYGIEKDFEYLLREYITAPPLGKSRNITHPLSKKNLDKLIKIIFEISKIKPKKLNFKLKKFNSKNYLVPQIYEGLVKKNIISKELYQKMTKLIKNNFSLLEKESHCFCHGDLNLGNILSDQKKFWIIDWELIHLNNFAYDIGYLVAHLWEAKRSFRQKLMEFYLKKLPTKNLLKFKKLLPVVVSYLSLGGIELRKEDEKKEIFQKRRKFYVELLRNCLNFNKLIKV